MSRERRSAWTIGPSGHSSSTSPTVVRRLSSPRSTSRRRARATTGLVIEARSNSASGPIGRAIVPREGAHHPAALRTGARAHCPGGRAEPAIRPGELQQLVHLGGDPVSRPSRSPSIASAERAGVPGEQLGGGVVLRAQEGHAHQHEEGRAVDVRRGGEHPGRGGRVLADRLTSGLSSGGPPPASDHTACAGSSSPTRRGSGRRCGFSRPSTTARPSAALTRAAMCPVARASAPRESAITPPSGS